jgi:hypothetical protein
MRSVGLRLLLVALTCVLGLALPSTATALTLELVNESGRSADDVYVTVAGAAFDVPGMTSDVPVRLSAIPGQRLTINTLVSGRIYVAYGAPVTVAVPFNSPTRFDWGELTVTPGSADVANLTAVDQFGIGMRLDTLDGGGTVLETVGSANSATVFDALQQIPGGPQATVRDDSGAILRVLSPLHSTAYPDLGGYVRSLSGQRITLRTAFFGAPFATSEYSGTFAADGSIALAGTTNPANAAPASFTLSGSDVVGGIATGANTPNTLQGAITRDLLAGFSVGLWGGRYGNDALAFCTAPVTTGQGSWCPKGFDQPAFGDARSELASFATCEQYAAVINAHADVYGNPYSDASKRVTVGLDQPGTGGTVATLRMTILPDTGTAQPVAGGNPNCGAATPRPLPPEPPGLVSPEPLRPTPTPPGPVGVPAPRPLTRPAPSGGRRGGRSGTSRGGRTGDGGDARRTARETVALSPRPKLRGAVATVGRLRCATACGRVELVARADGRVVARNTFRTSDRTRPLRLRLTRRGSDLLRAPASRLRVRLVVVVRPADGPPVRRFQTIVLRRAG